MRHSRSLIALVGGLILSTLSSAQEREPLPPASETVVVGQVAGFDEGSPAEKLAAENAGTCGLPRAFETRPAPSGDRRLEDKRGLGKLVMVDALTGEPVYQHLKDYLPAGWGKFVDSAEKVDSFGNPIVNEAPGLPGWAQRDVDALRAAIGSSVAALEGVSTARRRETERLLGNYLAQALIRGIDVTDIVTLKSEMISPDVALAVLDQMSFYESVRRLHSEDYGYAYSPTAYSDEVVAWIEAHGSSVQEIHSAAEQVITKAAPSGCYSKTTFTRGMTYLSGSTVIWNSTGTDDASADVPIGFQFNFYGCSSAGQNFNVRVSTNGYLTFFEQGGGALDGVDFGNDPIPSTTDPDGYVAPHWDDLWIAPSQGSPDVVSYLTQGASGSRVFTVEWLSVSHLGGVASDFHYFQVKLFEATGNVELHFDTLWSGDSADSATVGIEDFAGVDGDCGPNCLATNTGDTIPSDYRFSPARPTNDLCGTGCLASDRSIVGGNNLGATGTDITSCSGNDIHDVWYWYHAPVTGNVTFDTCSFATFDTTLSVFDNCTGGVEVGCNDDSCGAQSLVTVALAGGQDYYVRVAGWDGGQGGYTITASPASLPSGDSCSDAWLIANGFLGFTANNSGCVDQSSCAFNDTVDEWFAWTSPGTGTAKATTCNPGTDFDTTLAVYTACGGAEIACNDDTLELPSTCSTIEWAAVGGVTYYIRAAGFDRGYGNYELTVTSLIFADGFESGDVSAWSGVVGGG